MLKSIPQKQMKSIAAMIEPIKSYISNVKTKHTYVRMYIYIYICDRILENRPYRHKN